MRMIKTAKMILIVGLLTSSTVFANIVYTQSEYDKLSQNKQNSIASMWNITSQDYAHYLQLMHNSPSSKWYKQLNPAEVLGINAASDKDRMHYAMIVVKNVHDRIARELAFQKAYDKAWKILYPKLKPISKKDNKGDNKNG